MNDGGKIVIAAFLVLLVVAVATTTYEDVGPVSRPANPETLCEGALLEPTLVSFAFSPVLAEMVPELQGGER